MILKTYQIPRPRDIGIINDIQQPSEGGFWLFIKRLSSYRIINKHLKNIKKYTKF